MLYPRYLICKAIPKYISGRTSYFQVCLAFHPYPQLIRAVFNLQRFGPPRDFTHASPWPWIDQPVSGMLRATQRRIRTRFRSGFTSRLNLAAQNNSLTHYAKGTRSHCLQADGFRYCFTPLTGVLFTFPSRYLSTIGHRVVFSLGRWSSRIPAGFLVPRGTWGPDQGDGFRFTYRPLTFSGAPFQMLRLRIRFVTPRKIRKSSRPAPRHRIYNASGL